MVAVTLGGRKIMDMDDRETWSLSGKFNMLRDHFDGRFSEIKEDIRELKDCHSDMAQRLTKLESTSRFNEGRSSFAKAIGSAMIALLSGSAIAIGGWMMHFFNAFGGDPPKH
jgi:hypothetical protein